MVQGAEHAELATVTGARQDDGGDAAAAHDDRSPERAWVRLSRRMVAGALTLVSPALPGTDRLAVDESAPAGVRVRGERLLARDARRAEPGCTPEKHKLKESA